MHCIGDLKDNYLSEFQYFPKEFKDVFKKICFVKGQTKVKFKVKKYIIFKKSTVL